MRRSLLALLLFPSLNYAADPPLLLQRPAVERQAGRVRLRRRPLGRRPGRRRRPPADRRGRAGELPGLLADGKQVAFAGEYEGNLDVYVVPAAGGVPQRLTHHPDPGRPRRLDPGRQDGPVPLARGQLCPVPAAVHRPVGGGQPTELPLPQAEDGSLSPDGKRIAYVPLSNKPPFPGAFRPLRNYRGGTASPIWIADLSDSSITKVPRKDSNDFNPMWVGDTVYFLSDRDGPTTLFAYDPASKEVKRLLDPDGARHQVGVGLRRRDRLRPVRHAAPVRPEDARSPSRSPVRVAADLPGVRPKVEKVAKTIQKAGLSPTGARAVFEARGEIFTVPAEKGDVRNLTHTPGAADRDPAWSPDGKSIAYFSDESGEYELHVRAQDGHGEVKKIKLGDGAVVLLHPVWSPDSKKIAYTDKRLQPLVHRPGRAGKIDQGGHRPLRRRPARPGGLVARQQVAGLRAAAQEPPERRLPLLAGNRQGAPGHRRHERRPVRRRSTRAASTSTSPPAPTSARRSARACRSSTGRSRGASTWSC